LSTKGFFSLNSFIQKAAGEKNPSFQTKLWLACHLFDVRCLASYLKQRPEEKEQDINSKDLNAFYLRILRKEFYDDSYAYIFSTIFETLSKAYQVNSN
jgi:hypothetical protein